MFRLIPSIFGHAKSCWDIFKHQILFQRWLDAILCIAYYIFCTHTTSVTTFACLQEFSLCIASSALNYLLCVHRARMGAQSSAGRGLVNLRPRERIGQSYPAGKDARWIHPCRMEQIDSVKINPSLVMMREYQIYKWGRLHLIILGNFLLPTFSEDPSLQVGEGGVSLPDHR